MDNQPSLRVVYGRDPTIQTPVSKLDLKGVNAVKSKNKGGVVYHYYIRATGLKLGTSENHPAVLAAFARYQNPSAAVSVMPDKAVVGTVSEVIERFYDSPEFSRLAKNSKVNYRWHLEPFRSGSDPNTLLTNDATLPEEHKDRLGDVSFSVRTFGELHCRWITKKWVKRYLNSGITTNDQMNKRISHLRRLFSFALEENVVHFNPFSQPGKLATDNNGKRTERWTPDQLYGFLTAERTVNVGGNPNILAKYNVPIPTVRVTVPWNLRMAVATGLYACQRKGDVLDIQMKDIFEDSSGWWINIWQNKSKRHNQTPKHLHVWIHPPLLAEFKKHPLWAEKDENPQAYLCPAPSARDKNCDLRWDELNFNSDMAVWKKAAIYIDPDTNLTVHGIDNRTFHDLRRTGMIHMRERGASLEDIASVSGHTLDETLKILEVYIPRSRDQGRRAFESILGENDQFAGSLSERQIVKQLSPPDHDGDAGSSNNLA